jgi:hypothetical protein
MSWVGILAYIIVGGWWSLGTLCMHADGGTHAEAASNRCCIGLASPTSLPSSNVSELGENSESCTNCIDSPIADLHQLTSARAVRQAPHAPDSALPAFQGFEPRLSRDPAGLDIPVSAGARSLSLPPRVLRC